MYYHFDRLCGWRVVGHLFLYPYSDTYLLFLLPSVVMKIDIPYGVAPSVKEKQIYKQRVGKRFTHESVAMDGVRAY